GLNGPSPIDASTRTVMPSCAIRETCGKGIAGAMHIATSTKPLAHRSISRALIVERYLISAVAGNRGVQNNCGRSRLIRNARQCSLPEVGYQNHVACQCPANADKPPVSRPCKRGYQIRFEVGKLSRRSSVERLLPDVRDSAAARHISQRAIVARPVQPRGV